MVRLLVQSEVSESFEFGGNQGRRCPLPGGRAPQIRAYLSTQDGHARTHTHKTAQQSRGGMMDHDRKNEVGASSEPAFNVSQVCLRMRGFFGLTGEFLAVVQIERGQGSARLEHNDVTCGAMTAVGVFL